jgi:hypothetical protein
MRGKVLFSFENRKDAAAGSTTLHFYPTSTTLVTFIWPPRYSVLKLLAPAVASGMPHDQCTMAEDLLVSVFAFYRIAPNFPEVYERKAH